MQPYKMLVWCLLFGIIATATQADPDPCVDYNATLNEEKRSVNYTKDDFIINDVNLPGDTWYRPISRIGTNMPTFAPDLNKCGTKFPIWLDGVLPEVEEGVVVRDVCTRMFQSTCHYSWEISVKNCRDFFVYRLEAARQLDSAYCFGSGDVPCPVGESSVTGYYPDCTDSGFPKDDILPDVVSTLKNKVENGEQTKILEPVFQCMVDKNPDSTYYYDIFWYINDDHSVIDFKKIPYSSIRNTDLLPEHWVGKHKMNMRVKCSVRMRLGVDLLPSPYFDSTWFEAGVFPSESTYQVIEGTTTTIKYDVTVPVGCFDEDEIGTCEHKFDITQPNYQTKQLQCSSSNIKEQDLAFEGDQNCKLELPTVAAGKNLQFKATGYIDGKYNGKERATAIRLKSNQENLSDRSGVWDDVVIPDVKVVVTDADEEMKGRMCQAYNDPHFCTFDRKRYDFYGKGIYVLYRHRTLPYEVQVIFTSCNRNRASCHCGIAIRSGKSMLTVRLCDEVTTKSLDDKIPVIRSRKISCDEKSLYYEIVGSKYTVTLPTGTQIIFEVGTTLIKYVNIKPSVLDTEQTEGLCGFVSKESKYQKDDYLKSDGTTTDSSSEFAKSWKVDSPHSLFVSDPPLLKENNNLRTYCECITDDEITDQSLSQCKLTAPTDSCNEPVAGICPVDVNQRRKRDTEDLADASDDVEDEFSELVIDPDIYEETTEQSFEWINGWTYEAAEETCTKFLTEKFSNAASEASGVQISDYINSCIDDIKISGTTEYMSTTLSTIQTSALTELKKNATLEEEPANGGVSMFEQLTSQLCENNCNNNGICVNGACLCNENFGDFDCSKSKTEAPKDVRIPSSGLCGTRSRKCKRTNVYGQFSSDVVFCKRRQYQIEDDEVTYTSDAVITKAIVHDAYKVSCDIDSSRKKRSVDRETIMAEGYEISVSNDGQNFSETVVIVIYDDLCYSCNASSNTCEGTIFLNTSSCEISTQTIELPEATEKKGYIVIISAAIGSSVIVTVTLIAVIFYCKSKAKNKSYKKQRRPHVVGEFQGKNIPPPCFFRTRSGQLDRPATITSIGSFELGYGRKTPEHLFRAKGTD